MLNPQSTIGHLNLTLIVKSEKKARDLEKFKDRFR